MSGPFFILNQSFMTQNPIVAAAKQMETLQDLLNLLNTIKMASLGEKGHAFRLKHLKYFIHPARNKDRYTTFCIPKKSGGFREISAPNRLLKSFLTYTNVLLLAFYEAPECVTGFVPGKSVVDNAAPHVGKNYVFNMDLKDFFPSIQKSRVWATLKHHPFHFNDTIADAIAGLCCTEKEVDGRLQWVLPQGSPCSPVLTNIVCRNLDRDLYRLAKKFNLTYTRYADDLTFSGNRNVFQPDSEFRVALQEILTKQRLTINEKKTRLQTKRDRQEVTGLVVSDRVNVTRDYVRGIDNLLYIWERYGEKAAYVRFLKHYVPKQNLQSHMPDMRRVLQGKLLYLKMVKGPANEVWRRLQRRFNVLVDAKPTEAESKILYRYTIADFEQNNGSEAIFETDEKGLVRCFFIVQGRKQFVALSKYVRTRLTNILAKNDAKALANFKVRYLLVIYENMWRLERKNVPGSDVVGTFDLSAPEGELVDLSVPDAEAANSNEPQTLRLTTDEMLQTLISSNFDLNKLDLWDKTKSS